PGHSGCHTAGCLEVLVDFTTEERTGGTKESSTSRCLPALLHVHADPEQTDAAHLRLNDVPVLQDEGLPSAASGREDIARVHGHEVCRSVHDFFHAEEPIDC